MKNIRQKQVYCRATITILMTLFATTAGCGDEENNNDRDGTGGPPQGDTHMDGGPADASQVDLFTNHCPGVVDEKKGVYYCVVSAGEITNASVATTEALTWISLPGMPYVLDGRVFVGDGVGETILTIEPGTLILGNPVTDLDNASALIIQRNSKIIANGTPEAPIVFTSANPVGERLNDDWGGVVINGNAPINICNSQPCEASGEGATGTYGGQDPADSSGSMSYVRIEFSGKRMTADKEFNGLALQGVGSGTDIHHIQIHRAGDDSIEFFGGTANVHHILLTGTGDDSFDWVNGWSGKAQFVIAQHLLSIVSNNGIEADNNESNFDYEPRANPTLYNFTLYNTGPILLRRGTAGDLGNFLIKSNGQMCLDLADSVTWGLADNQELYLHHSAVYSESCFADDDLEGLGKMESTWWSNCVGNQVISDPMLTNPDSEEAPSFLPLAGSPVFSGATTPPAKDAFFESVTFIGAMGDVDWTAGWTSYPLN